MVALGRIFRAALLAGLLQQRHEAKRSNIRKDPGRENVGVKQSTWSVLQTARKPVE